LLFTLENPILKQGMVWLANIPILLIVWLNLGSVARLAHTLDFCLPGYQRIVANKKSWINLAVVFSSIIFGPVHFDWELMGVVQTGFMGLMLGISFLMVKRNLWILVIAHAYMDAILMIQKGVQDK
jgi:hypothetical protein